MPRLRHRAYGLMPGVESRVHFFGDGVFLKRIENISGTSVDLRLRGTDRLAVIVWPPTIRETSG